MDPKTRIEAIRERAESATKGPWRWWTSNSHHRLSSDATGKDGDVISAAYNPHDRFPEIGMREEDAAFIAASREDVPWLIEQLELRTAAGDRLAQEVQRLDHANGELRQLVERKNAALRALKREHAKDLDFGMGAYGPCLALKPGYTEESCICGAASHNAAIDAALEDE